MSLRDEEAREQRELWEIEQKLDILNIGEQVLAKLLLKLTRQTHKNSHLLHRLICRIDEVLSKFLPVGFLQNQGEKMPITGTITGLKPGGSDTFFATPINANGDASTLPAGSSIPKNTSPDAPGAVFVDAADGLSTTITADPSAASGTDFGWTVTASLPDGTVISSTVRIPVTSASVGPVGFALSQGKPAQ